MNKEKRAQLVSAVYQDAKPMLAPRPKAGKKRIELIESRLGESIFRHVRVVNDGRPDRLIPLVSQAVLQVQAHGHSLNVPNLVVLVAARHVSSNGARAALKFAEDYAPDVAVGILDLDGQRLFSSSDLENQNLEAPVHHPRKPTHPLASNLFSDLNQWMLKLLLARHLNRRELMGGPISQYKNASELAEAAQVSVMSAFRFLEQLKREGFLHESSDALRLVRVRELLDRWQALYQRPAKELPVRWLLPSDSLAQVSRTVKAYGERCCAALFAAAHAHGFRHVTGVPIHLYVDSLDAGGLERMGVVPVREHEQPDIILRIPLAKEAVFRAQVMVGRGHRACDILQVWLDVASYPARGREQADLIYRKVIEPMLLRM